MSAKGEFDRLAEECIAYLEASSSPDAERYAAPLRQAVAGSAESLDDAASAALDTVASMAGSLRFAEPREREEFDELAEHLAAICRAITGRPEPREEEAR